MTAVASPSSFSQISRPPWGGPTQSLNSMNSDDVRGILVPRKTISRASSSSSVSTVSSSSSTVTAPQVPFINGGGAYLNGPFQPSLAVSDAQLRPSATPRKRPQLKSSGPAVRSDDFPSAVGRAPAPPTTSTSHAYSTASHHHQLQQVQQQLLQQHQSKMQLHNQPVSISSSSSESGSVTQMTPRQQNTAGPRPVPDQPPSVGQPVLHLVSLNGTFERKTISVPCTPHALRIGRQTNPKTAPSATNGFFDSKVLSRQHAEIWSDDNGKVYIRDIKSSNGTFVNGKRLSPENRESEPHELTTADHLELGIDIVNEDQKTVVHHKVAAKVEHAGFLSPSNNLLDMTLGDLDPTNGAVGSSTSQIPYNRGRTSSNASTANQSRFLHSNSNAPHSHASQANRPGVVQQQQRPFWLTHITTDHIVRRLQNELRSARLQSQDLQRTGRLIGALLSKDDIRNMENPEDDELARPPHHGSLSVNDHGMPFPSSDPNYRFCEPPAPPPQQPLPEKPDVPSLRRHSTEKPKLAVAVETSPVLQDTLSQVSMLSEALNNVRKDFDSQSARVIALEEMLREERAAREMAEDVARRLEEAAKKSRKTGFSDSIIRETIPEESFEPPILSSSPPEQLGGKINGVVSKNADDKEYSSKASLQSRLNAMTVEFSLLNSQLDSWKQRCARAEAEKDATSRTMAEMILQAKKETEARQAEAQKKVRSRSRRGHSPKREQLVVGDDSSLSNATTSRLETEQTDGSVKGPVGEDQDDEYSAPIYYLPSTDPTVLLSSALSNKDSSRATIAAALPYASMLGVVLIGMGLMAYLNGWQPPPPKSLR